MSLVKSSLDKSFFSHTSSSKQDPRQAFIVNTLSNLPQIVVIADSQVQNSFDVLVLNAHVWSVTLLMRRFDILNGSWLSAPKTSQIITKVAQAGDQNSRSCGFIEIAQEGHIVRYHLYETPSGVKQVKPAKQSDHSHKKSLHRHILAHAQSGATPENPPISNPGIHIHSNRHG
jgi:hypothetical protein